MTDKPETPVQSAIYDAFVTHAVRCTFARPWDFLAPAADCYGALRDAAAAERQLRSTFAEAELCAARVLEADGRGGLKLNPRLTASGGGFVVLRDGAGRAFDIFTDCGPVSDLFPPAQLVSDSQFQAGLTVAKNNVLLVFSIRDLILCRALGVAAAPAMDLTTYGYHGLCWLYNATSSSASASAARQKTACPPQALTLVAASLHGLSDAIPAALPVLARYLHEAEEYLYLVFGETAVWWPRPEEMDFFVRLRDRERMQHFLGDYGEMYDIAAFQNPAGPAREKQPSDRLQRGVAQLVRLLGRQRADDYSEILGALQEYSDLVEEALIAPLQQAALAAADPQTAVLQTLFAQLARELFAQFPVLHANSLQRLDPQHATALDSPAAQRRRQDFSTQVGLLLRMAAVLGADGGALATGARGLGGRRGRGLLRLAQQHMTGTAAAAQSKAGGLP